MERAFQSQELLLVGNKGLNDVFPNSFRVNQQDKMELKAASLAHKYIRRTGSTFIFIHIFLLWSSKICGKSGKGDQAARPEAAGEETHSSLQAGMSAKRTPSEMEYGEASKNEGGQQRSRGSGTCQAHLHSCNEEILGQAPHPAPSIIPGRKPCGRLPTQRPPGPPSMSPACLCESLEFLQTLSKK